VFFSYFNSTFLFSILSFNIELIRNWNFSRFDFYKVIMFSRLGSQNQLINSGLSMFIVSILLLTKYHSICMCVCIAFRKHIYDDYMFFFFCIRKKTNPTSDVARPNGSEIATGDSWIILLNSCIKSYCNYSFVSKKKCYPSCTFFFFLMLVHHMHMTCFLLTQMA
jgi:hypothetical protein